MAQPWVAWPDRNAEFAPVIGLHKHELFYPTTIEAFIKESCDLMVYREVDSHGIIQYDRVVGFPQATLQEKIQYLLNSRLNKKLNYLGRHGGVSDMRRSAHLQQGESRNVYVRGFRNQTTREAYIVYWLWYVENFVPQSSDDATIRDVLNSRPDDWWFHQGNWEAVSFHFTDFQASHPQEVIFSQHEGSQTIAWGDTEKFTGRVMALPALGTHANYNRPVIKKRSLIYVDVASNDDMLHPSQPQTNGFTIYNLEEMDPLNHLWLLFKGRWGNSGGLAALAPTGPLMKRKRHFQLLADK